MIFSVKARQRGEKLFCFVYPFSGIIFLIFDKMIIRAENRTEITRFIGRVRPG